MNQNFEIVIAHYNEDLERIKPYAKQVIIYHKGNESGPRFFVKKRVKLPNVGREGHTYLYHIINNRNNLADITVFLQGRIEDHDGVCQDITKYIKKTKEQGFFANNVCLNSKRIDLYGASKSGTSQGSGLNNDEFFQEIFGKKQPLVYNVFYYANFGVSKQNIQQRTKKFYEKIINYMDIYINPIEGYYLERLRFRIFNDKKIIITPKIIYYSLIAILHYIETKLKILLK